MAVTGHLYLLDFSRKFPLGSAWGPTFLEELQEVMNVSECNSLSLYLQGSSRSWPHRKLLVHSGEALVSLHPTGGRVSMGAGQGQPEVLRRKAPGGRLSCWEKMEDMGVPHE